MIPQLRLKIEESAFNLLLEKTHSYYQNVFAGALATKVNHLSSSVPDLLQLIIDDFLYTFVALNIAIVTLWNTSPRFALLTLAWASLFFGTAFLCSKYFTSLAAAWAQSQSTLTGKVVDSLSNILAVRLFTGKPKEKSIMGQAFYDAQSAEQELQKAYFWIWVSYSTSFIILQGISFYWLLKGYQDKWITIGDFALILMLNSQLFSELWNLTRRVSSFSDYYGRITEALQVILPSPEIQDLPDAKVLITRGGEIHFDHIFFSYPNSDPLFENLTITLTAGQKVGLVGYSGGGKTTFINLLSRLYDLTGGRIFIDGQDIKEVIQDSLRAHIALIPQDPSLFHRTLMENIRYGRRDATDNEVIEAAKQADAHKFIIKLHQGYDALVGERGIKLSGGQRQRIAIARAILKNAPILILDEATSQLDSITESQIQDNLWNQMEGKTTLVIAHRLSTLLRMDRILVFDQGKVVEDGHHSKLLMHKGLYQSLWDAQVGGFLPMK